ncbi:MAG: glycosyltransferase family 4 protein [Candidatus Pelagibacter sp.]
MKILLSAYACEPNTGSEPNVGWNWALGLSDLGHNVTVITRKNNESKIKRFLSNKKKKKINFIYYDLPSWLQYLKKKNSFFLYIYYYLWQYLSFKNYKYIAYQHDLVHHITFGTYRFPSFFSKINRPLIFGPVGGAETTPINIIKTLSLTQQFREYLRYISNFILVNFNFQLISCVKNSYLVISRTEETKKVIQGLTKNYIPVISEIGINSSFKKKISNSKNTNYLFVGRHIYWKGGSLVIQSFNEALKKNKNIRLNFVGDGPQKKEWMSLVKKFKIQKFVKFHPWQKLSNMKNFYKKNDVFIFPSFHDSGAGVVNEALSYSLPVICLDLGAPGAKIDYKCGFLIKSKQLTSTIDFLIKQISNKILLLSQNKSLLKELSNGAYIKSKSFTWKKIIKRAYKNV